MPPASDPCDEAIKLIKCQAKVKTTKERKKTLVRLLDFSYLVFYIVAVTAHAFVSITLVVNKAEFDTMAKYLTALFLTYICALLMLVLLYNLVIGICNVNIQNAKRQRYTLDSNSLKAEQEALRNKQTKDISLGIAFITSSCVIEVVAISVAIAVAGYLDYVAVNATLSALTLIVATIAMTGVVKLILSVVLHNYEITQIEYLLGGASLCEGPACDIKHLVARSKVRRLLWKKCFTRLSLTAIGVGVTSMLETAVIYLALNDAKYNVDIATVGAVTFMLTMAAVCAVTLSEAFSNMGEPESL